MKIVVFTGAGISAESGIKTFRDHDGLWDNYSIEDVCTYNAWLKNPELVQEFYNQRRKQLYKVNPNPAHYALAKLEKKYDVEIITQNVDDLHERAGSSKILHLHGELKKARSTVDENLVYDIDGYEIKMGDKCEKKSQLRPHIVWFGEAVPKMQEAADICSKANILIVTGTSLNVYPAAGLINSVPQNIPIYLVDPGEFKLDLYPNLNFIKKKAGDGIPELVEILLKEI